jgi:ParB family chromosome partitioning protein
MTSGNFFMIPVNQVIVGDRVRKKTTNIPKVADSIRRLGLIHPIVVDLNDLLAVGAGRLEAIKLLGWTHIPAQRLEDLDPKTRMKIELEENIKRQDDLTWQEEAESVMALHEIYKSENPDGWTQQQTAEELGMEQPQVSQFIKQVEWRRKGFTEAWVLPEFSAARNRLDNHTQRRAQEASQKMDEVFAELFEGKVTTPKPARSVHHGDFHEWAPVYTGSKFNFIHCDFPYGIDTDKRQQGNVNAVLGGYDDIEETYWRLLRTLCDNLDRICAKEAHIMFWFSMKRYAETLDFLRKNSDFVMNPIPLIWYKDDKKGLLPDPLRGPRQIYEAALFGSRGDRKIVKSIANLVPSPTVRSFHPTVKPEPVLRDFFRMFVDGTTTMLDPCCGSGTALQAAKALGAKYVFGVELDKDFAEQANHELEKSSPDSNAA